jgi:hypothetical protein
MNLAATSLNDTLPPDSRSRREAQRFVSRERRDWRPFNPSLPA